jgi:hypothetical protein
MDGSSYEIDGVMTNSLDGENIGEKELKRFVEVVRDFKSLFKFDVVYSDDYYFIAIIGYKEGELKWTEEVNSIYNKLGGYLLSNNIIFN